MIWVFVIFFVGVEKGRRGRKGRGFVGGILGFLEVIRARGELV